MSVLSSGCRQYGGGIPFWAVIAALSVLWVLL